MVEPLLDFMLRPWHLIVLAVVAFILFWAMGQSPSKPRKGPPGLTP
jgi:hypothetical protein